MRLALLAILAAMIPAAASADDAGCDAAKEVLNWTAEALVDIRDGHSTGVGANAGYIVDAANYADDRTRKAGWPESYFGVLEELAYLAATIRDNDGKADPAEAASLLAYADALGATTAERCGAEVVPVFVRPGIGDSRACPRVIDALVRFKEVIPALRGKTGSLQGMVLFAASVTLQHAAGEAEAAQWSETAVRLLIKIAADAGAISDGTLEPRPATGAALVGLATVVADEAKSICTGQDIPDLAASG